MAESIVLYKGGAFANKLIICVRNSPQVRVITTEGEQSSSKRDFRL